MLDWDKLRIFFAVAQAKNITKAAEDLGVNQSSISRQITALEEQLRTPLFHRRPRGLLLTEQGDILLRTVADFYQKLTSTETALLELHEKPRGELKVTVPASLGTVWLVPLIKEFIELYPEVHLNLMVDDRKLDLSMREADVAIRMYPTPQPDVIQKQLFTIQNGIYASNDYLQHHGTPKTLKDLESHIMIGYTEQYHPPHENVNWLFDYAKKKGVTLRPRLSVNSLYGMLRAMKSGIGIAPLPDYMVERAKRVSRILDDISGPDIDAYFVYPVDLKNSKRVRAFHSFMQRKLTDMVF